MNASEMTPTSVVTKVIETLTSENEQLKEGLNEIRTMIALDDRGWDKLLGAWSQEDFPGFQLEDLQEVSEKISQMMIGSPIIKRGVELRASYVWSKGFNIPGLSTTNESPKKGRRTALDTFYNDARTKNYVTSPDGAFEMERNAFATGLHLLAVDTNTKKVLYPLPISEISGIFKNPDYSGEVWGYVRKWKRVNSDGKSETKTEMIYTDRFTGTRKTQFQDGNSTIPVAKDKIIIDQKFNSQVGWPLGAPDAVAAIVWARIYSELMNHGKVMTESLARFAMKVTTSSKAGASNIGVKLAKPGKGQTAALGTGNDLVPLSSAGKAYDFNGIRAVAAMVATALEVSIVALLSDPGAAGSSYGAASNLDLPTKRAMVSRQNMWVGFLERLTKWATKENVNITFPEIDDPDPYREMQVVGLGWNTGLIHPEEARPRIIEIAGMVPFEDDAPEGVMLPNNEKSWARKDVDPALAPSSTGTNTSASSPDQGRGNNAGGSDSALTNDQRTDTIEGLLRDMGQRDFLDEFASLIERAEALKTNG